MSRSTNELPTVHGERGTLRRPRGSRCVPSKRSIHERDDYVCQYCAIDLDASTATVDHVIPVSRGGRSTAANLVSACHDCNQRKADRTPEEAGMPLLARVGILR